MKPFFALFMISLVCCSLVTAQQSDGTLYLQSGRNTVPVGESLPPGVIGDVKGSPYLFEDYRPGYIMTPEDRRIYVDISYDAINYEVVVKLRGQAMALSRSQVAYFSMVNPDGDTMIFRRANEISGGAALELPANAFVEVLYQGERTIAIHHRKNFLATSNQTSYNNGRQEPEYNSQPPHYYLLAEGEQPTRVKLRAGWLKRFFQEYDDRAGAYLKENRPDLNTKAGLIQVVEWLDSLEG